MSVKAGTRRKLFSLHLVFTRKRLQEKKNIVRKANYYYKEIFGTSDRVIERNTQTCSFGSDLQSSRSVFVQVVNTTCNIISFKV